MEGGPAEPRVGEQFQRVGEAAERPIVKPVGPVAPRRRRPVAGEGGPGQCRAEGIVKRGTAAIQPRLQSSAEVHDPRVAPEQGPPLAVEVRGDRGREFVGTRLDLPARVQDAPQRPAKTAFRASWSKVRNWWA